MSNLKISGIESETKEKKQPKPCRPPKRNKNKMAAVASTSAGDSIIYDGQVEVDIASGDDCEPSIYHTVLMGNEEDSLSGRALFGGDQQFGNLSVISPAFSDGLSTKVNVGSIGDLGGGVTSCSIQEMGGGGAGDENSDIVDGELYPDLSDMEEEEGLQLQKDADENKQKSIFGSIGFDVVTDKEFNPPVLSEQTDEDDDDAVKELMQEILDKFDANMSVDVEESPKMKSLDLKRGPDEAIGAISSRISTSLPMKGSQRKILSAELVLNNTGSFVQKRMTPKENANTSAMLKSKALRFDDPKTSANAVAQELKRRSFGHSGFSKDSYKRVVEKKTAINAPDTETCPHIQGSGGHSCHICVPIPEDSVSLLKDLLGLTATEARKAAFILFRYLKDHTHTEQVKLLMKYISGAEPTFTKRPEKKIIHPQVHTKEQKFRSVLAHVSRQKGAWGIFEDDEVVVALLEELNQLMTTLDRKVIGKCLRENRYQNMKALCTYFALEKRWTIRQELLASLDLFASNDNTSLSVIMSSDLPLDLFEAIRQEYIANDGGQERIYAYATVLCALLRTGLDLQVDHLRKIDAKYTYVLLQISEGKMKDGCSNHVRDSAIGILLAYNLQFSFDDLYMNVVIGGISGFGEAEYLKQKMLHFIINKEVRKFQNQCHTFPSPWCHTVVKLALDILMCNQTAEFFIDADLNIMLAGLCSFIAELESGDDKRTGALQLSRVILRRLGYQHNGIRRILQTIRGILNEKEPESRRDKKIARKIARELDESRVQFTQC